MNNKDNALVKWIHKNKSSYQKLATATGMSKNNLLLIVQNEPESIRYKTAVNIYKITGLQPYDYIKGLEIYKKIYLKSK